MSLLGYSTFSARLPAALMSVLGCLGVYQLAKWAGIKRPVWCFVLFATFPLQIRYAAEARPYSQALCAAIWLTVTFLHLRARPGQRLFWIYAVLCTFGLYTQPFTLFVAAAHATFAAIEIRATKNSTLLRYVSIASVLAVLAFIPWYLFARAGWRNDVNGSDLHFRMHAKLPLEILRELTGAGYAATLLVIFLAVYALRSSSLARRDKWFWAVLAIIPSFLALFADMAFDYFFAIRQFIFLLLPLAVLAVLGLEAMRRNGAPRLSMALTTLFIILNVGYSIRWFIKYREDWGRAAHILNQARGVENCIILLPDGSAPYYEFYVPGLEKAGCNMNNLDKIKSVYVAVSPYFRNPKGQVALQRQLQSQGFTLQSSDTTHEPDISVFRR